MPIYQYECKLCKKITEGIHRADSIPKKLRCSTPGCGRMARRIIARSGAIQCDSINDVKWLPSACKTLVKGGDPPITSRTEYKNYMKKNHLAPIG